MAEAEAPTRSPEAERLRASLLATDSVPRWRSLLVLLASLAFFMIVARITLSVQTIAVLVGVLFFHEGGHFIGMRLFGYRDVRMFFIPFFGAAVSGRPQGVSAAKRGVVLLLGPLPGIALGAVIAFVYRPDHGDLLGHVVSSLLLLNALNLLPIEPFDGGKLVHLLVAARYRVLDIASLVLGVLLLGYFAVRLSMWSLGGAAFLAAASIRPRLLSMRAARDLRAQALPMPERIEDAPDVVLESLASTTTALAANRNFPSDAARDRFKTTWARDLYERARSEHPHTLPAVVLGLVQLLGFLVALGGLLVVFARVPGQVLPLSQVLVSDDGHVTVHVPKGLKKVKGSPPNEVKVSQTVRWTAETLTVRYYTKKSESSLANMYGGLESRLAKKPGVSSVREVGACKSGAGSALEWDSVIDRRSYRSYMCLFEVEGRLASFEIALDPNVYADMPVLIAIGEASELHFGAPVADDDPSPDHD